VYPVVSYQNPRDKTRSVNIASGPRDLMAANELSAWLQRQGCSYGEPLLNFPAPDRDAQRGGELYPIDVSFVGSNDWLLWLGRPAKDDREHFNRKQIQPAQTDLEQRVFDVWDRYLDICPRSVVMLTPDIRRLLPRGYESRWNIEFKPAAEGAHPGALHRWAIDKAVFRRPCRRIGGSVLIDTSGSMSFRPGDLDAILDASRGAALVAIYSGRSEEGQLRIVARAGRRASPEHLAPYGGGNIVDEPALRWLASQPGPRFWVSDGGVTGVGDVGSAEIRRRCDEICRAAIRRFPSAREAAQGLAIGARGIAPGVRGASPVA